MKSGRSVTRVFLVAVVTGGLTMFPRLAAADWPDRTIGLGTFADQLANIAVRAQRVAEAKIAANAEIADARRRFFEDCVKGIRGAKAEQTFTELLLEKDIYFLSLYMSEGMTPAATRRIEGIDNVTGGKFDGGLPPWPADDAFHLWVDAVRTELNAPPPPGILFPPSPSAYAAAIAKSADVYAKYKPLRDRAEFARWRKSIQVYAAPPDTPLGYADEYVKYFLDPDIEAGLDRVPEGERAAAARRLNAWREQLHQAVLDFESTEITPEKLVDQFRQQKYADTVIQSFTDTVDRARGAGQKNLLDVIIHAQQEMTVQQDRIRDPRLRGHFEPRASTIEFRDRAWIYSQEAGRLTSQQASEMKLPGPTPPYSLFEYLYGPGQPVKFARDTYNTARGFIAAGKVATDPEWARQCR